MSDALQIFIGIGVLIVGIGYIYGQFKQGFSKSKLDAISLLEADVRQLNKKSTDQEKLIATMQTEMEALRKTLTEKDAQLNMAMQILQGRDPSQVKFMAAMEAYVKANQPILDTFSTKILPIVERMDKYLNHQSF